MSNFAIPWTAARQSLFTIFQSLLKLLPSESEMLSNHLILCFPLLLLPSIFPSIRVFSDELALCIRWPKELQLEHQSFQWIFRVNFLQDWLFDLLAVQGTFFGQNSSLWPVCLGWSCIAWLIASLSYSSPFTMISWWPMKGCGKEPGF